MRLESWGKVSAWHEKHKEPAPTDWTNPRLDERDAELEKLLGGVNMVFIGKSRKLKQDLGSCSHWTEAKKVVRRIDEPRLVLPVFEKAIANGWAKGMMREIGGKFGWERRDWMGHWFRTVTRASESLLSEYPISYGAGCGSLLRWLEKGRFDHDVEYIIKGLKFAPREGEYWKIATARLKKLGVKMIEIDWIDL